MEYRLVEPSEMEEAIELADLVFRNHDPEKKSLGKSNPQAFSSALNQSYGAFKQGKLVAFIGLVPSVIYIGPAQLQCFSLGGVCTHPDHRGNGYAGRLMDNVLQHVDDSDASLLIISGNRSLYSRTDCFPYGAIKDCRIDASSIPSIVKKIEKIRGLSIRSFKPTDWFDLRAVSATKNVGFERSLWDWALLLEAEPSGTTSKLEHEILVAEQNGVFKAFIVVGVPYSTNSSQPVVYEWAGDAYVVASLIIEAIERYALKEVVMRIPWHELDLIRLLTTDHSFAKNNGTIRIMDSERLMKQLQPYLLSIDMELTTSIAVTMSPDGTTQLRIGNESIHLDRMALTSLVFDKDPEYNAEPSIRNHLTKIFPIPFPGTRGLNFV